MGVRKLASLLSPGKRGLAAARAQNSRRQPAPAVRRRRPFVDDAGAGDRESLGVPHRAFARDAAHGMMPGEDAVPDAETPKPVVDEQVRFEKVMEFYEDKIQKLTMEQGDRDHLPISGNIYMYRAIAKFGECKDGDQNSLFQSTAGPYVWSGIAITIAIQIIGPLVLLIWAILNVHTIDENVIGVQAWRYHSGSSNWGFSYLMSRILAIMFLLLFTINGTYALKSDMVETEKMVCLCRIFNKVADKKPYNEGDKTGYKRTTEGWLWLGALVNSYLVIALALCMLFIFIVAGGEAGPKDIIFDAFGITFLYNLDDPSGDLSFLDDLWDEGIIGDIYGTLADQKDIMEDIKHEREHAFTSNNVYQIALYIMNALIFLLPTCFIFFELKFVGLNWEAEFN